MAFLLKKVVGVGLLVIGLVVLATGMALSYTGLTVLGAVLLLAGIASLVLKIMLRNQDTTNA
ncbi:MAG: hypothetical protein ACTHM2_08175 [Afipia sp.]